VKFPAAGAVAPRAIPGRDLRRSYASAAVISRFLGVEPEELRRMIDQDGLPAQEIPGPTRRVLRILPRALYEWLGRYGPQALELEGWLDELEAFRREEYAALMAGRAAGRAAARQGEVAE
jgi:hypothetical protein